MHYPVYEHGERSLRCLCMRAAGAVKPTGVILFDQTQIAFDRLEALPWISGGPQYELAEAGWKRIVQNNFISGTYERDALEIRVRDLNIV